MNLELLHGNNANMADPTLSEESETAKKMREFDELDFLWTPVDIRTFAEEPDV